VDLEKIRSRARELTETAPAAPAGDATPPSSDTPTGRSRRDIAAGLFPEHFGDKSKENVA
jgi:hypothetical protein